MEVVLMNHKLIGGLCLSICLFLLAGPVLAHHGGSAYDKANPLTLKGAVKGFFFIQPHPLISLEGKDDKRAVAELVIEMTAPNHHVRYDWKGKGIHTCDEISV